MHFPKNANLQICIFAYMHVVHICIYIYLYVVIYLYLFIFISFYFQLVYTISGARSSPMSWPLAEPTGRATWRTTAPCLLKVSATSQRCAMAVSRGLPPELYVKISVQMPQNVCNFTRMVHIISGFFGWSVFLLDLRCFHIFLPFGNQRFWGPRGASWMDSGSRWSRWTWKCPRDLERSRSSRRPPVVDIVMGCHRGALGWLKYHDWVAKKICKRWGGWSLFYPH